MASTFISLPVTAVTGPIDVTIDASLDSIRISDGTDTLSVNPDGSINVVNIGANELDYNEITAVASGATGTVITHTFATAYKLRMASCSGTNIATWTVLLDGFDIDKKRTNYTNVNCEFDYEIGISISAGSTIAVTAANAGTSVGNFNARLLFSPA